jgi:predicted transcriptional regulator
MAKKTDTVDVEEVETPNQEVVDLSPIQVAEMAGVRPQMVYNYISGGRIEAFRNDAGKLRITVENAEAWIEKYQTNKVVREQKRQAKLEAELNGE